MLSGVGPVPPKQAFKAADTLSRHLEELCRAGAWERRAKDGDKGLLDYIEAEARDLSLEAFGRLLSDVYQRIGSMLFKGWVSRSPTERPRHVRMGRARFTLHVRCGVGWECESLK
jgi:hypothetical protein